MQKKISITEEGIGKRLDSWAAGIFKECSRTKIKEFIQQGKILVNSRQIQPDYRLKNKDMVWLDFPEEKFPLLVPEKIPLKIIFEDDEIVVVNKPAGLIVHPARSDHGGYPATLAAGLLYRYGNLSTINGLLRPGIVHRLDKDTSGVMVVARNNFAHLNLAKQFKEHTVKKFYLALVHGKVTEPEGEINLPIGHFFESGRQKVSLRKGKESLTRFRVRERFGKEFTLLEVITKTGRTHQIRVHFDFIGHPVVGDKTYRLPITDYRLPIIGRQALHSYKLGFIHPVKNTYLEFTAPLPQDMKETLKMISPKTSQNLTKLFKPEKVFTL